MPASYTSDDGLHRVTLNSGTQLWLGVTARATDVAADGAERDIVLPMLFWAIGQRNGDSIGVGRGDAGDMRLGMPIDEMVERMRQDGAPTRDIAAVITASRDWAAEARRAASEIESPVFRDAYAKGIIEFSNQTEAVARTLRGGDRGVA